MEETIPNMTPYSSHTGAACLWMRPNGGTFENAPPCTITDPVTGLPDGRRMPDIVDRYIDLGSGHPEYRTFALVHMDLDRFHTVNRRFGHRLGDELLFAAARRLEAFTADGGAVFRYSADEFYAILPSSEKQSELYRVLNRLLASLAGPYELGGCTLSLTVSAGISLYPYDGAGAEELMGRAATALQASKEAGGRGFKLYLPEMAAETERVLSIESELAYAAARNQLSLDYQPIVRLDTGELCGAEALMRWSHPVLGKVPPSVFIPAAERSGLIVPLGEWALEETCRQHAAWMQEGLGSLRLSVNVSAAQLLEPTFPGKVEEALKRSGMKPSALILEITESLPLSNAAHISETFDRLKRFGVTLALDDFGTGFSSYACLTRHPFHILKIDSSLVQNASSDPYSGAVLTSLLDMARKLGMKPLAEGVETEVQRQFLIQAGCGEAQGFLFCPPMSADRFGAYRRSRSVSTPP